ncbi:SDR family NAD(P)-dependent oxidoreductase [Biformimicrobium ophioploci]|uniref:SDR family NAD(P)-dependent oxidoreductase n=1 Tax=Biformimicrobium ophioploci TaxID=3036711 RepID=A0ABQ6M0Y2_9GAMM|nr:SDR family NAD(P)-dependent oxidoreductase [Microbulbifer sp. NKW57]GMG87967.1 SDR family NAD(P)-dependent oxidoreductase [Microbulbifer sp. NKW57]
MHKTILITGATDGIGLATARALVAAGHRVLVHGRSAAKLAAAEEALSTISSGGPVETYKADLSRAHDVTALAETIANRHSSLDVLINNAGVFKTAQPIGENGLDVRFMVNTIAPWLLTKKLMPLLNADARVINLSSAAQASVDPQALAGKNHIADDFSAYAQSKLALTIWSRELAQQLGDNGPAIIAVNPGSLLASKMVKEGFEVAGKDINIGVDILLKAALSEEFASASGKYFDNDSGRFAEPHPSAKDRKLCAEVMTAIETTASQLA